jgi:hypothetical protein
MACVLLKLHALELDNLTPVIMFVKNVRKIALRAKLLQDYVLPVLLLLLLLCPEEHAHVRLLRLLLVVNVLL